MMFWIGFATAFAAMFAIDIAGFSWLIIREHHYDHKRNNHSEGDK
ncbi:hypothetical protein OZX73_05420 [Bifidobacterium sp. ESL0775]|nr:hypothetical protein [Bifidobacterium sp. ESL0775]WEV68732.1 hypothetical protein OZX73_05420 [Bifidobacterium sp. ESL0775]